jgi:serine/threonine protein kinase
MQVRIASIDQPIPGYRLLEPLGRGGFGEVWKAEAPGGLLKAIKLVHGSFASAVGGEEHVQKELRSLDCVKGVRHPFILSMDRWDLVRGQLLIVMELADRNLWDRFEECKKQGLPGIPRDELLHYMAETADALDVMNLRYNLVHSDVKPQNLFLVHNHIKVADFGLVRDLGGMKEALGSGISPVYAAPESFHGVVSRHGDQYSLAVVYQELLTGKRPFDGSNARQMMMQHVSQPPDLTPLPPGDRPAVRRALAKEPEQRFPSCEAFVNILHGGPHRPMAVAGLKPSALLSAAAPTAQRLTAVARPHAPATGLSSQGTTPKPASVLAVRCPSCGFTGQVPMKFQGRPVKCRACGQAFPVTGFTDAAAPATASETAAAPEAPNVVPEVEAPTSVFLEVECPVCSNCGPVPEGYRGRRLRCRQCGCVHREGSADVPAGK